MPSDPYRNRASLHMSLVIERINALLSEIPKIQDLFDSGFSQHPYAIFFFDKNRHHRQYEMQGFNRYYPPDYDPKKHSSWVISLVEKFITHMNQSKCVSREACVGRLQQKWKSIHTALV